MMVIGHWEVDKDLLRNLAPSVEVPSFTKNLEWIEPKRRPGFRLSEL
jgi:hypothetical protein